jgi:PAS domain S-box-containing protein
MRSLRYQGALLSFFAVLIVFSLAGGIVIITEQRNAITSMVLSHEERDLELMADASYEALLKHDYDTISTFVQHWGREHAEYTALRATAPNGFVISEFVRPAPPGVRLFSIQKNVMRGTRRVMLLEITGDYRSAVVVVERLRNRLIAGSIFFFLLLGAALWYVMKRMALLPMQQEIELRKKAEEELEMKVVERTVELNQELAERRRIERDLLDREEHIRLLLNSTAEAIYGVDTNGVCTFCNPACLKMLGYETEQDLVGKNLHEMIHHTRTDGTCYPEEECRINNVSKNGQGCHVDDEVFWRADGTFLNVEYWSHPIVRGQELIGAVITFIDITERRMLEAQLLHAQKMEAVGTLAGGVAHDFNNILTAIIGYGTILRMKLGDVPLAVNADRLLDAAQRAALLTKSLLAFSRKQEIVTRWVDLNDLVSRTGKLIKRLIRQDIVYETVLTGGELGVMVDSAQIEQVLMNLATNARDAMPDGGRLSIRTERVDLNADYIRTHQYAIPGEYALITVSDTGMGMDENTRSKIFEPFFTTKEVGKGTGLGLSMAYGIVKQHKGFINVTSEIGTGTAFKIYLPIVKPAGIREEEQVKAEEPIPRGSEMVLVAEDDLSLRLLAKTLLEEHGYRVIEAEDGEEAVRKFKENQEQVKLLLFDIIMPRLDGRKAYEEIRRLRPNIKVLFASGYTEDLLSIKDILDQDLDFIQKPMRPHELLMKVRTVLDR